MRSSFIINGPIRSAHALASGVKQIAVRVWIVALVALFFSMGGARLVAQTTVYWDTNGNTAGSSGGTTAPGTWNQNTTANWSTSSTGGTTGTWQTRTGGAPGNGIAVFGAGTNATGVYSVTVGAVTGVKGITFDEGTVTLTGGSLTLAAVSSAINTDGNDATIGSTLAGVGFGINKTGAGTLTLSGNNTFTGGAQITTGTLQANTNTALGTGTVTIGAATIQGGAGNRILANSMVANGNFTVGGATDLTFSGGFNLGAGNRIITIDNSGVTTMSGVVSNSYHANITKAGSGTLVLSGTNTFTGPMTVSAGVLNLQNSSALGGSVFGNSVAAGAELQLQGGITVTPGDFAFQGTGLGGVTGGVVHNISGSNTLGGQLTFSNASTVSLEAGTLTFSGTVALSTGASIVTTSGAGNLIISGQVNGSGGFTFGNTGNVTLSGVVTSAGPMILNGPGTVTLSGSGANSGGGAVTINAGILVLAKTAGTNALQGDITINNDGTLRLGASNQMPSANSVTITSSAGLYDLNGNSDEIAGLTMTGGSVTTGAGTLSLASAGVTTNASASTATISGKLGLVAATTMNIADGAAASDLTISAVTSGAFALSKTGNGMLTLSGANTYTGATTVTAGTLSVATIGNGGVAGNMGQATNAAANLVFDGGALQYTGATASTNRNFTIIAGKTATIDVTTNNLTISGASTATNGGLTKTGAGTLTLSGTNLHTGVTTISNGTLSVASIGDGGVAGNLGKATNAAGNLVFDGGALQYTGGSASTNRNFTIIAGKTATIDVTASTLTMTGAAAATTGSLNKTGVGTLTLSGANAFTGGVTVSNGTLLGSGTTDRGGFAALGNYTGVVSPTDVLTVNSGATLAVTSTYTADVGNGTTTSYQNLVLNGSGYAGGGALRSLAGNSTWTGNTVLNSDATITNVGAVGDANELFIGAFAFNTASNVALNGHTLTFNGPGNTYVTSKVGAGVGDTGSVIINGGTSATTVSFAGYANYYTGSTTVNSGQLYLKRDASNPVNSTILGNLTIGSNSGSTTARVINAFADQIADTSQVTINSDGTLDLATDNVDETIGSLVLNGGTVTTGNGVLHLANGAGTIAVHTGTQSTISGRFGFYATNGTIDVDSGSTLLMAANVFGTNFTKTGAGTMVMTYNNYTGPSGGYSGTTTVANGILNIRDSGALGTIGSGTIVNSGATLQLQKVATDIQVTGEVLTISGAGASSLGALNSVSGANSWQNDVILGASSTIKTTAGSLTLGSSVTAKNLTTSSISPTILTVGGAGDTTILSVISNGPSTGVVSLTKVDAGTLTLSRPNVTIGGNTFTGAIAVNGGTLALTANNVLAAQTNAVSVAAAGTLSVSGGSSFTNTIGSLTGSGLVSIAGSTNLKVNTPSADTFDGRFTGAGLFEKAGAGTFTFSSTSNTSAFNFAGTVQLTASATTDTLEFKGGSLASALTIGTLKLTGGTLLLTNSFINVGTLNITGSTILDFGTSGASILNATNIYIAAGAVLTIKNWNSEVDFLFANSDFRQNNGSGTLAVHNATGTAPENQVWFQGDPQSPTGAKTTWIDNATNYYSYANNQIRPVPEPATYGAIFIAGSLALLAWRRRKSGQSQHT
jgi:fibronectin-binding autotransporter adhesin